MADIPSVGQSTAKNGRIDYGKESGDLRRAILSELEGPDRQTAIAEMRAGRLSIRTALKVGKAIKDNPKYAQLYAELSAGFQGNGIAVIPTKAAEQKRASAETDKAYEEVKKRYATGGKEKAAKVLVKAKTATTAEVPLPAAADNAVSREFLPIADRSLKDAPVVPRNTSKPEYRGIRPDLDPDAQFSYDTMSPLAISPPVTTKASPEIEVPEFEAKDPLASDRLEATKEPDTSTPPKKEAAALPRFTERQLSMVPIMQKPESAPQANIPVNPPTPKEAVKEAEKPTPFIMDVGDQWGVRREAEARAKEEAKAAKAAEAAEKPRRLKTALRENQTRHDLAKIVREVTGQAVRAVGFICQQRGASLVVTDINARFVDSDYALTDDQKARVIARFEKAVYAKAGVKMPATRTAYVPKKAEPAQPAETASRNKYDGIVFEAEDATTRSRLHDPEQTALRKMLVDSLAVAGTFPHNLLNVSVMGIIDPISGELTDLASMEIKTGAKDSSGREAASFGIRSSKDDPGLQAAITEFKTQLNAYKKAHPEKSL